MAFAQVGPLTTAFELLATVVGAGIVLGSFALGVFRLAMRQPRAELEGRVLTDGYVGGLAGLFLMTIDLVIG